MALRRRSFTAALHPLWIWPFVSYIEEVANFYRVHKSCQRSQLSSLLQPGALYLSWYKPLQQGRKRPWTESGFGVAAWIDSCEWPTQPLSCARQPPLNPHHSLATSRPDSAPGWRGVEVMKFYSVRGNTDEAAAASQHEPTDSVCVFLIRLDSIVRLSFIPEAAETTATKIVRKWRNKLID